MTKNWFTSKITWSNNYFSILFFPKKKGLRCKPVCSNSTKCLTSSGNKKAIFHPQMSLSDSCFTRMGPVVRRQVLSQPYLQLRVLGSIHWVIRQQLTRYRRSRYRMRWENWIISLQGRRIPGLAAVGAAMFLDLRIILSKFQKVAAAKLKN